MLKRMVYEALHYIGDSRLDTGQKLNVHQYSYDRSIYVLCSGGTR